MARYEIEVVPPGQTGRTTTNPATSETTRGVETPGASGRPSAYVALPAPGGWIMMPDQVTLIASVPEKAQLIYIDTVAEKETKRVDVDFQPTALALQGKTLFAAAKGSAVVYALDVATGKVKKEFDTAGNAVARLACHPTRGLVYASSNDFVVSSIDPASGKVARTAASGYFLAVDPLAGAFVYAGLQPRDREELVIEEDPSGTLRIYFDDWGPRAMLMKYEVKGENLQLISSQDNAAVNGTEMHLTPDGKRLMIVGGGGWRPKDEGQGGGYIITVYSTDELRKTVGQIEVGAYPHNVAFHPALNTGVAEQSGSEAQLLLFNARAMVVKNHIKLGQQDVVAGTGSGARLLTFGARGTKIIYWTGKGQHLRLIPLELNAEDKATLAKAYPK